MTPYEYLIANDARLINELIDLLRIPSISACSSHKNDVRKCAEWVANHVKNLGFSTEIMETGVNPVVMGNYNHPENKLTLLVYGHYDVQPADPLELWFNPPFLPLEINGKIYARGAMDDKGQFFSLLKGIEALLKTSGKLPVNIRLLIEGEEENDPSYLPKFLETYKDNFKADVALISDSSQFGTGQPAITLGLRGVVHGFIWITGPDHDLHSGIFGGSVANPIHVLCDLLGSLHDEKNRVTIPGFYDRVYEITQWEKQQLARLPFERNQFLASTGAAELSGESGFTVLERIWCRPTFEVNGITGGYQGSGIKTIIPSWALARVSMRLVPYQDPSEICNMLEAYLREHCPKEVRINIETYAGCKPYVIDHDSKWISAAQKALARGFGVGPFFIKDGGSVPIVDHLKNTLGLESLLIGFGQKEGNAHSPNENMCLEDFRAGCRTMVALLEEIAALQ